MADNSELFVITKAKDIVTYVFLVSENAPKKYRFTLISHIQNTALDVLESLIMANEMMIGRSSGEDAERLQQQHKAIAKLKVLDALAMAAREKQCILPKQHEALSRAICDCLRMTGAWINSDKKRYKA